ncbi:hypothetical protein CgunFtcFv8_011108 [Champsocephalus gunnari]|uniref:Uncharacterized protein n=1 Tax=Champsocephalus gunnari TaxID=52237 RepID=A0AAN8HW22_CHAGU|nr:hypothetical protein CgunFtcFv8_011108 [Champsocephalus gunnari]
MISMDEEERKMGRMERKMGRMERKMGRMERKMGRMEEEERENGEEDGENGEEDGENGRGREGSESRVNKPGVSQGRTPCSATAPTQTHRFRKLRLDELTSHNILRHYKTKTSPQI